MDQIAQQLKEEILSLQNYNEHTEKRVLAINWVEILLNPFEQVEGEFGEHEIKDVVAALTARNQFSVNGHLADRVDGIIDHYKHLAIDDLEDAERASLPAKDPALFPSALGEDEDEESTDQGPVALSLDDLIEHMGDSAGDALVKTDLNDIDTVISSTSEAVAAEDLAQDQQPGDRREKTLAPAARPAPHDGALQEGNADELFAAAAPNPSPQEPTDQPAQAPGLPGGNAE